MKKALILTVVMLFAIASMASASWITFLRGTNASGAAASQDITFGELSPATGSHPPGTPMAANCMLAIGWTQVSDAWVNKTYYAAPAPTEYEIFAVNGSSYTDSQIYIKGYAASATFLKAGTWYLYNVDASNALLWSGDLTAATSATAPLFASIPATTIGTRLLFTQTEIPIIPEPGSLLALGSGLIGLIGFGIRRRK